MDLVFQLPQTAAAFESQWQRHPADIATAFGEHHGEPTVSLHIEGKDGAQADWNQVAAAAPTAPGQRFEAEAVAEGIAVGGGNGVVVSLGFYDAQNRRIDHVDNFVGPGTTGKREVKMWAEAPDEAVTVKMMFLLHGFGEAHFSQLRVKRLPDAAAPPEDGAVTVAVSNEKTTDLIGFGFEDDGWFYNAHNAEKGADEAAIALREARIAWMAPDYVRMFFWYNDWNPSLDAESFTWDSDNMQSHYRTLDLYQRLGARVNVCGVEWAVKDPWADPERLARAKGALLEHLIVTKGYTCIQDYTLTNEPDIFFARAVERSAQDFETFVRLHVEVTREFERRGLRLNIVGSDDGHNRAWFAQAVSDDAYFDLTDLYASHFYFSTHSVPMAAHVLADRVQLLRARDPVKPFIIAELGFSDARMRPPDINPLMGEYAYAMLAMSTFLDGLNAGTAGWSVWCVHEMYYPGGKTPMRFGLWDFDPPEWPVRPIYHALALMTRNTRAGEPVYRCASTHPDWVKAARVGDRLFWANLAEEVLTVSLAGASAQEAHALEEALLLHDRDCSVPLAVEANRFTAPPRSFGMIELISE